MHSTHPDMGHGLRCRPDDVYETGVSPGGQSPSPIEAAEAEQIDRTRRKTWSRARSEVFVPYKHPDVGRLRVTDVMHEWVHHDANHDRQILANVQAAVWPHMGNARRFSQP
jgi:hypothetical protein